MIRKSMISAFVLAFALLLANTSYSQTDASKPARLIVYRNGCIYGLLAHFKVKKDDQVIGSLGNKSIHTYEIPAGSHIIAPRQAHRGITVDFHAGQTYVIKYRTLIGLFGARPRLKLMTVDEANADSRFFREHGKMAM